MLLLTCLLTYLLGNRNSTDGWNVSRVVTFTGRYTCRALASRSRQFDLRGLRAVSVGGARVWPAGSRVESVREDARLFSCEGRMKDV